MNQSYDTLLDDAGIPFKADQHYYTVNLRKEKQTGATVYLSVIFSQARGVLSKIIPALVRLNLSFSVIKDETTAIKLLTGQLGTEHIGKVLVLRFQKEDHIENIIDGLSKLAADAIGPSVPGCKHLGTLFYEQSSVMTEQAKKQIILQNNYMVLKTLKEDVKGDVYKCLYIKGLTKMGVCVIKEGKKCMWSDELGRDIRDRLKWQKDVCDDLHGVVYIPKIIDLFEENDNFYLAMAFIKGVALNEVITQAYSGNNWKHLSAGNQTKLLSILLQVLQMVESMHEKGYIHRDLNSENFIVDGKGKIVLIDLELAYNVTKDFPAPPFRLGSPGYMSPEQQRVSKPTFKEDVYGFGALMSVFFTGRNPRELVLERDRIQAKLFAATGHFELASLISKCFDDLPYYRPSLSELKVALVKMKQSIA